MTSFLQLLICGQALSHCVNYTTRDIIEHWDKNPSSLVLLTDGMSKSVPFNMCVQFITGTAISHRIFTLYLLLPQPRRPYQGLK